MKFEKKIILRVFIAAKLCLELCAFCRQLIAAELCFVAYYGAVQ